MSEIFFYWSADHLLKMESIFEEHRKLSASGNLSKSLEDVQKTIDLLTRARDTIAASRS